LLGHQEPRWEETPSRKREDIKIVSKLGQYFIPSRSCDIIEVLQVSARRKFEAPMEHLALGK